MPTKNEVQFVRNVRANNYAEIELDGGAVLNSLPTQEKGDLKVLVTVGVEDPTTSDVQRTISDQPFFGCDGHEKPEESGEETIYELTNPRFNFWAEEVVNGGMEEWW
jgi:hypothetical protein